MKLSITITMDNAAFEPANGQEAAHILGKLAAQICDVHLPENWRRGLLDTNGNKVGVAKVEP